MGQVFHNIRQVSDNYQVCPKYSMGQGILYTSDELSRKFLQFKTKEKMKPYILIHKCRGFIREGEVSEEKRF